MQPSAGKPSATKLPRSQFNGFVRRRHRVPAMKTDPTPNGSIPGGSVLPKILPNLNRSPDSNQAFARAMPNGIARPSAEKHSSLAGADHAAQVLKLTPKPARKTAAEPQLMVMEPLRTVAVEKEVRMMAVAEPEMEELRGTVAAVPQRVEAKTVTESEREEVRVTVAAVPQRVEAKTVTESEREEVRVMTASEPERKDLEAVHLVSQEKQAAASQDEARVAAVAEVEETTEESATANAKPKPAETQEELQTESDLKAQKWSNFFQKTSGLTKKTPDGTRYEHELCEQIKKISFSYFTFKRFPLKILQSGRVKAAAALQSSGSVQVLCDIISEEFSSGTYVSEDKAVAKNHIWVLKNALSSLVNYSDASDEVTYGIRDHEHVLGAVLKQLTEWAPRHLAGELSETVERLLKQSMSILHNVAMWEDNVERLRDLNTTQVLMRYLESSKDYYKLSAYATLADVVSEEEADKLCTSPHLASFLLKCLQKALKTKDHRCQGWCITELVRAVRRLARNEANKRLMVEQGALPLLTQGVKSTVESEKCGCMETVWVLSFDKQNVEKIMKSEELVDIAISAAHDYSQPSGFRHAASGLLFQLRDELRKSEKYSTLGQEYSSKKKKKRLPKKPLKATGPAAKATTIDADTVKAAGTAEKEVDDAIGHVMMSYQWADQAIVKDIRDILRAQGFRVWMDIDNMGGSTLQAMAEAVEDAFVVLTCMSQKYKDSPNTRAEAEYAFQQRKKIIPLIMQQGYKPDGWLGMILGAKLFYDFSGKYSFESRVSQLLKAVHEAAGTGDGDATDGEAKKQKATFHAAPEAAAVSAAAVAPVTRGAPAQTAPSINSAQVKDWAAPDVKEWLKKFGLDGTELEKLTGKEIVFLHNLRAESPEFFYKTLEKKLQIRTLSGLMSFTEALSDLPST